MNSSDRPDLSAIADLYAKSLRENGPSPKGVGWNDEAAQTMRFDKLTSVISGDSSGEWEVAELGVGYGALVRYLRKQNIRVSSFVGYDISDEMLAAARQYNSEPWCRLVKGDCLEEDADYAFASGIFNVKFDADPEMWRRYVESVIDNLNRHSRRGFAFNALSIYVDYRRDHLFYADPLHFFDYCKRNCGPRVALLHDYPLYEWTVTVSK